MTDPELESLLAKLSDTPAARLQSERLKFLAWDDGRQTLLPSLAAVAVSLANTEGGTVIVGIAAGVVTGCAEVDLEALRRAVYSATSPAILIDVKALQTGGKTLLVVTVPKGLPPHIVVTAPEPVSDYSAQLLDVGAEAIDPLEVERLRNVLLAKAASSNLLHLPNEDFLNALDILRNDSGRPRLTVAGLLLVGREAVLKEQLPGHETVYLHMAKETEYDRRGDYRKPLLAILDDLTQQVELHNKLFTLKVGLFHFEIPDYPPEVYREALLNAFTHRDYSSLNPVYIRFYADRLEIANPGCLIGGITTDNIVSHEPVTRNRLLAEILQKLRLVERSGMGVRRMFTIQLSYGKEPPFYSTSAGDVRVILRSGKTDEHFARFIAQRQQQGDEFNLNELIALAYLKRNQELDLHETTRILQRSDYEAHEALSAMVRRGLLEPFGQKKGRVYRLSKAVYVQLRQSVEYHLHRDAEAAYAEAAISNYIRQHGFITNLMVRTLLRVNRSQSSYLLRQLVRRGKLVLTGRSRKAEYRLP
jgi:ATP-dependent DNA helicase RecG